MALVIGLIAVTVLAISSIDRHQERKGRRGRKGLNGQHIYDDDYDVAPPYAADPPPQASSGRRLWRRISKRARKIERRARQGDEAMAGSSYTRHTAEGPEEGDPWRDAQSRDQRQAEGLPTYEQAARRAGKP
ncbi:hypothetical protein Trco_002266 [Trichoderma cornu-damae]|uniref:Uncharacterized protein n=1 Tax=Trichoderma cornu-damae TaxID=654480 RepID=A0A9P8QP09_9HYPO|nr:hypothetical protein Trco_002266 [Trichoderma cornu-damae]